ncbi:MAG TPA: dethiobiotin synthase [Polyangiaceae bacterium]
MNDGIFVTATGTDVGKTFVTALLVKTLRKAGIDAGYYKAALSGAELVDGKFVPGDAAYVKRVAELPDPIDTLVSYVYREAVSPHLAAQHEGNPVEISKVLSDYRQIKARHEFVCVEGSGGLICPIRFDATERIFLTDIVRLLELDLVVIAPAAVGTINSTLLTLEYARSKDLGVRGVILNHYTGTVMERDNAHMIERLGNVPILARVAPGSVNLDIDPTVLRTES